MFYTSTVWPAPGTCSFCVRHAATEGILTTNTATETVNDTIETENGAVMLAGHTRWRRTTLIAAPLAVASIGVALSMAAGILAATFAVSGTSFAITSNKLSATGFDGFGSSASLADGSHVPSVLAGIKSADLDGICLATPVSVPGVGKFALKITADGKLSADNLKLDVDQLSGNAEFHNAEIGRDATTLTKGPAVGSNAGVFGLQADSITVDSLNANALSAAAAGTFKLPGLKLNVVRGSAAC
jgi:hypothetical protein